MARTGRPFVKGGFVQGGFGFRARRIDGSQGGSEGGGVDGGHEKVDFSKFPNFPNF